MVDSQLVGKVCELEQVLNTFKIEVNSINSIINDLRRQLDHFRTNDYVTNSQFADFKNALAEQMKNATLLWEQSVVVQQALGKELSILKDKMKFQNIDIHIHSQKIDSIEEDLIHVKKLISISSDNQSDICSKSYTAIKDYLITQLEDIKRMFVANPKSAVESNLDTAKKVEMAQLDSQNAMLKLGNLETQFRIFDRKLENLDIRTKKIELAQIT